MDIKRLTLFAGHYGSGKTTIALNYAYYLKNIGKDVTIADLDIVNPYFRTQDSEKDLKNRGIDLIVSEFAGSNIDAPSMPKEIYGLIESTDKYGVLDIGGDDRGALALGRYVDSIKKENNYNMLFVINSYRPLTRSAEETCIVKEEIENACKLKFTGIVNNTNLGPDTTIKEIENSIEYASKVKELTGLPIYMTTMKKELVDKVGEEIENVFPMEIQNLYYMLK